MDIFIVIMLGLEFGSFANACIYRWPLNLSVFYPRRSFCPWCKKKIFWWENIPLVSYLFLKGKCSGCHSEISFQYPLVEIIMPLLWLLSFLLLKRSLGVVEVKFIAMTFLFLFAVVVSTWTDFNWRIIPDEAVLLVLVTSLLASPWNLLLNDQGWVIAMQKSFLGAITGGGMLLLLSQLGKFLFERESLGWGDIKLMTAYGAFLGGLNIVLVLFWGSVLGGGLIIVGLLFKKVKRYQYIPFAPFLNLGALIVLIKSLSEL